MGRQYLIQAQGQVWGSSDRRGTGTDLWLCEITKIALKVSQGCLNLGQLGVY